MTYVDLGRTFSRLHASETDYCYLSLTDLSRGNQRWSDLLQHSIVVVLASASTGKSEEFRHQATRLTAVGEAAFFCALEELSDHPVEDCIDPLQTLRSWRQSAATGYFFLDAVDETKLKSHSAFGRALRRLRQYIGDHLSRARFFVSCRPSDWNQKRDSKILKSRLGTHQSSPQGAGVQLTEEEALTELVRPLFRDATHRTPARDRNGDNQREDLVVFRLDPLTRDQQQCLAERVGNVAHPRAFIDAIRDHGLDPYAARPGDLLDLARQWNEDGAFGPLATIVERRVVSLLSEEEPHRTDRESITDEQAMSGAKRIAAALVLGRAITLVAPGADADSKAIDPADVLPDWTPGKRETLLRRGVFSPAALGRVRFHHRSSMEFLAAKWFADSFTDEQSRSSIMTLFFPATYGVETVSPQLRPIAAWLAILDSQVLRQVLNREPFELIRHGDPKSLAIDTREQLLARYCEQEAAGDVSDDRIDSQAIWAFADAALTEQLRASWESSAATNCRWLLLRLIDEAKITSCKDLAIEASRTDQSVQSHLLIVTAVRTLAG